MKSQLMKKLMMISMKMINRKKNSIKMTTSMKKNIRKLLDLRSSLLQSHHLRIEVRADQLQRVVALAARQRRSRARKMIMIQR